MSVIRKLELQRLIGDLLGIGSAVGRVGLGIVADYLGRVRCFQATLIFTGVCLAVWPLCTEPVPLGIFAFCFGCFSGGFIALVPVVVGMSKYNAGTLLVLNTHCVISS